MTNIEIMEYAGKLVMLPDGSKDPVAFECERILNEKYPYGIEVFGNQAIPMYLNPAWEQAEQNVMMEQEHHKLMGLKPCAKP